MYVCLKSMLHITNTSRFLIQFDTSKDKTYKKSGVNLLQNFKTEHWR